MAIRRLSTAMFVALYLTACGPTATLESEYVERPVEVIYNNAHAELMRGNLILAAREFDEVERQHPYSIWARRALVMAAYTYYLQNKYDDSIATSRRFLALYPGNKQASYVYYLIAMCQYERIANVKLGQRITELAQGALLDVIRRYPQSGYAKDAILKLDLTRSNLAGKEMDVGRFYLKRREYVAAEVRFRNVIEHYKTSMHVPEALHRLTEVYLSLGVITEAQNAAVVLGFNYPDSQWYRDSYRILRHRDLQPVQDETSWLSRTLSNFF